METPTCSNTPAHTGVTVLAVRPHPDDESLATGGLLASYSARGLRTGVVMCTGGEAGVIHANDLDSIADKARLRDIREQELRQACKLLGVTDLHLLGYRDSGTADTPANTHPEAFVQADLAEAVGRLVRIIRALRPLVIVTEPPGGLYPHPDHVMCHRISVDAFHAAAAAGAYPAAGPAWQVPKLYGAAQIDDGVWAALRSEFEAAGFEMEERLRLRARRAGPAHTTVALDIRPYSTVQRQALLAHRTQIPPDSLWASLPDDLYRRAFATAYFIRLHPPTRPGERELDLLDGLDVTPQAEPGSPSQVAGL